MTNATEIVFEFLLFTFLYVLELGANLAGKELSCNDDESVNNPQHTSTDSQEKITGEQTIVTLAEEDDGSFAPSECVRILRDMRDNDKQFQRQHLEQQKQLLKAHRNLSKELAHIFAGSRKAR